MSTGAVDGAARLQLLQMVDEQGVVEGIGVVVVELAALGKGELIVALIIAVVGDEAHLVLPKQLLQPKGQGGLAAARAARDANDQVVHTPNILLRSDSGRKNRPNGVYCLIRGIIPHFAKI